MAKYSYEVVGPLRMEPGEDNAPIGGTVELDRKEGDALVAAGALGPGKPVKATAARTGGGDRGSGQAGAKPIAEQSFAELKATAKARGLKLPVGTSAAKARKLLEAPSGGDEEKGAGEGGADEAAHQGGADEGAADEGGSDGADAA